MIKSIHYNYALGGTILVAGLAALLAISNRISCSREKTNQIAARTSGQNFNFTEPTGYSAYTNFVKYTAKRGDTVSEILANTYGFKGQELTSAINRFVLDNGTTGILAGKSYLLRD